MKAYLEYIHMFLHVLYVFQSVLICYKTSASELSRKFIRRALLVGCSLDDLTLA